MLLSTIFLLGGSYFSVLPDICETCFRNLYLALVTCSAVGYAAFPAHDRDPAVYQILLS